MSIVAAKEAKDFMPSRSLGIVSAMAKGFGDYQKRLEAMEMQKAQQRSEMFKVIAPHYYAQQRETLAHQRELPFKISAEERGWAGLENEIKVLTNQWKIASMEATSKEDIATLDRNMRMFADSLDRNMEMAKANLANIRTGIMASADIGVAKIGAASREKIAGEEIAGRADVAGKGVTAATDRIEQIYRLKNVLQENEYKLQDKYTKLTDGKEPLDPVLKEKFVTLRGMQLNISKWAGAIADTGDRNKLDRLFEIYPTLQEMLDMMTEDINVGLIERGSTPLPTSGAVKFGEPEVDRWWGPILRPTPKIKRTPITPSIPGVTPAPAAGRAEEQERGQTTLPKLKTTGTDFEKYVKMMLDQKAGTIADEEKTKLREIGIDPDAVEKEARKRSKNR